MYFQNIHYGLLLEKSDHLTKVQGQTWIKTENTYTKREYKPKSNKLAMVE